jgi:hypothetical protein
MSDDLSNGPHGTDRREHVIRPGMLYGLFLQGFAYSFVSDKFRMFPESEVLTAERKQKGPLQDHFRAKVPVQKGKTAILTSRQQPTGFHRSFPSVGPHGIRANNPWVWYELVARVRSRSTCAD